MKRSYLRPVLLVHGRATELTRGRREADVYDYLGGYRFIH